MRNFIEEFKAFAIKGNVVELAVAVIIGGAFGKIVSSLVADIIMPALGIILGGISFTNMKVEVGRSVITYGVFLQSAVDFIIVAFVIFLAVKTISHVQNLTREEVVVEKKVSVPEDVQLLREIRDILSNQGR